MQVAKRIGSLTSVLLARQQSKAEDRRTSSRGTKLYSLPSMHYNSCRSKTTKSRAKNLQVRNRYQLAPVRAYLAQIKTQHDQQANPPRVHLLVRRGVLT